MGAVGVHTGEPIFGRDDVRSAIVVSLGVADGRAGAAILTGPPGVGKTHLAAAIADELGAHTLWGTCLPLSTLTVPFLALRTVFRDRGSAPRIDFDGPPGAVLTAIDAWVESASAQRRIVLVVDDLQWADAATLDALLFLLAGPRRRRFSLLATLRDDPARSASAIDRWLVDARHMPDCDVIPIDPLDRAATTDQISALLGAAAHESLVEDVWSRSGGSPYLTSLLVNGLDPEARSLPDRLPRRLVDEVLLPRERLESAVWDALRVLAVGGTPLTDHEAAAVLSAWKAQRVERAEIGPLLDRAVGAGLALAPPDGRRWFRHPLIAEALIGEMSAAERRSLHAAFLHAGTHAEPDVAEVVRLADHAAAADDADAECAWASEALQRAERGRSFDVASELAMRCLTLAKRAGADRETERALLERHLAVAAHASSIDDEIASIERLLELVGPEELPQRSELTMRRLLLRSAAQYGDPTSAELAALDPVIAALPAGPERAHALAFQTVWMTDACSASSGAAAAEAALDAGRTPHAELWTLLARMCACALAGESATVTDLAPRAADLAILTGDGIAYNLAVQLAADVYGAPSEDYALALRRHRLAAQGRLGQAYLSWTAVLEALNWFSLGRWDEADEALRVTARTFVHPPVDMLARAVAGSIAVRRGDTETADRHLSRAEEIARERAMVPPIELFLGRAEFHLDAGDIESAARTLSAGEAVAKGVERDLLRPTVARVRADAVASGGDPATRANVRAALGEPSVPRPSAVPALAALASAAHAALRSALTQAESARRTGDPGSHAAWLRVRDRAQDAVCRWEEAYACLRAAESALATGRGDRAAAAPLLRAGLRIADDLGAAPLASRLRELGRFARIPTPPGAGEIDVQPAAVDLGRRADGLTPRENEIVALVCAGRTYAEMAQELFVSEKTVSSHMSNVLRKTGSANRIELARWASAVTPPS